VANKIFMELTAKLVQMLPLQKGTGKKWGMEKARYYCGNKWTISKEGLYFHLGRQNK